MAGLTALLGGLTGGKKLRDVLVRLNAERATVSVQIEGSPTRFKSRLLFKDEQVILAKPETMRDILRAGKHVRFRVPDDTNHEVRLEIVVPQMNLASGSSVFICKVPTGGLAKTKRGSERHGVAHLSNVLLVLPKRDREFRLSDISLSGCRILTETGDAKSLFPLGKELRDAEIQVGSKAKVELSAIIPRSYHRGAVGCEFEVKGEGTSQVYLQRLIETLDRA